MNLNGILTSLTDLDECMGEGSDNECEQDCVNYPGGFNCSCFDGFELNDDEQCEGISQVRS